VDRSREQWVHAAAGPVAPHIPQLIDDFYEEIERHPDAQRVITGGVAQVERLKGKLNQWVGDLFCGPYDAEYVLRRWRVGFRHVLIGLEQVYTNAALSRLRILRRFKELQTARQEAADLRQTLADRKVIEQAKGMLMKVTGIDEKAAFRRLQELAAERNLKLIEAAQSVLALEKVLRPAAGT
jgi:truncated hemoglobin YjbI